VPRRLRGSSPSIRSGSQPWKRRTDAFSGERSGLADEAEDAGEEWAVEWALVIVM
jgi:hypothetical protein